MKVLYTQPLEAVQWTGENVAEVRAICPDFGVHAGPGDVLFVTTEIATHSALPTWWVIASHQMDVSVLSPELFARLYEPLVS